MLLNFSQREPHAWINNQDQDIGYQVNKSRAYVNTETAWYGGNVPLSVRVPLIVLLLETTTNDSATNLYVFL